MTKNWLLVLLVIAGLGLQAELWFADDGYRKTVRLRAAVAEQRELNESLRARNAALDAEVINLKQETIQRLVMSKPDMHYFRKTMHDEHVDASRESHNRIAEAYSMIDSSVEERLCTLESMEGRLDLLLTILKVLSIDWTVLAGC